MTVRDLHPWDVTPKEAYAIQKKLAAQVSTRSSARRIRTVAGVDLAFAGNTAFGVVVVLSFPDLQILEIAEAVVPVHLPYIPGLLSFREVPVLLPAFRRLTHEPDVIFADGQGRLHPRRFGIACHLGLLLDRPAIGCGKSLLCGDYEVPGSAKGETTAIRHRGETIGRAVRTRDNVSEMFISIGHKVSLKRAVNLVLAVTGKYRIPEPTRQADIAAAKQKRVHHG